MTSLRDRLSNRKQSPELVSKKAELQAYIQDARTFRQSISGFEAFESSAVASLLSELSDITPQGVWLERFGLDGEKIYLKGYATDTEKLVLWMDKFDESELLASKRFAVVELSRSEEGYQSFQLRTERREEPAEE